MALIRQMDFGKIKAANTLMVTDKLSDWSTF